MPILLTVPHWNAAKSGLVVFLSSLCMMLGLYFCGTVLRVLFGKRWIFPPGPRGAPVVGNLLQLRRVRHDAVRMAAYLTSLSQYGEMTTLRMGNRTWVMLNSNRVVQEIIAKRASITGERPYFPVASGLASRHKRTVLRQTKEWSEGRRVMHHLLNGTALNGYEEVQNLESIQLLANYLERPKYWYLHHYRYAYSVIHRIVLGEPPRQTQKQLDDFQRVTVEFIRSINTSLVDFFPVLTKLPKVLQPWRKYWKAVGQDHYNVFKAWWLPIKQDIAEGTAPPSFVKDVLLRTSAKISRDDEEAMYLATSIVAAGSDNVRMTLNAFIMAALCYPETIQKARDEIDGICGKNAERLPGLKDMQSLPYLSAMIKEGLRWRPTVPLIPQHHLTQDLEFECYRFPAGTDFVINSLAVCQEFENAAVFRPERWLDGKEDSVTQGLWQFGGGRRVCIGYKIAQQELFLAYSRLIYCFDFAAYGQFDSHRLRHDAVDEPFPVKIMVRGKAYQDLITRLAKSDDSG